MNNMDMIIVNKINKETIDKIMKEYMETIDTLSPYSSTVMTTDMYHCYIPCKYDLVNAFPDYDWEGAEPLIFSAVMQQHIFIRWNRWANDFLNMPIKEVW